MERVNTISCEVHGIRGQTNLCNNPALPPHDQPREEDIGNDTGKLIAEITALCFLWLFLASLALVLVTFNSSVHSACHLDVAAIGAANFGPLYFLLITAILIRWTILWIATRRAPDSFGVVLASLLLVGLVWLLIDIGILAADSASSVTWIVLVCVAAVLTVGISWSYIGRRMTGQVNVEDVE